MEEKRDEIELLAQQFARHRGHLRAVATRMLGSATEADDAVQEAWLRLSRGGTSEVMNLGGFLTTVVARVCLDLLRTRKSRREDLLGERRPPETPTEHKEETTEEGRAMAALGPALLPLSVMLDQAPGKEKAQLLQKVGN